VIATPVTVLVMIVIMTVMTIATTVMTATAMVAEVTFRVQQTGSTMFSLEPFHIISFTTPYAPSSVLNTYCSLFPVCLVMA
jgi:hypothetical protein